MLNIVFFGSHHYSLYSLEALFKAGYKICAVVTQPDRPAGRHQVLTPTPVKIWAENHKIPALTPKNKEALIKSFFRCKTKMDLGIVCVYGMIIPEEVLTLAKYGFLNIHPSLLPKYRGASPVQGAIISGEKETGVTVFLMDEKLDHGPIITQEKEPIFETDTAETLYHRLFKKGAELLIKTLLAPKPKKTDPKLHDRDFWGQCFSLKPQNDTKASYTRMLKRDDGFIPFEFVKAAMEGKMLDKTMTINFLTDFRRKPYMLRVTSYALHNFIRALSPWPGAWTEIGIKYKVSSIKYKKRLKLLKSHLEDGKLVLDLVQLEGKKPTNLKNLGAFAELVKKSSSI